jgi:hypothetical protein
MLREHPHVIDEVGEQGGDDAPVTEVDRRRSVSDEGRAGRGELDAALIAESGAARSLDSAGRALHDGRPPLQGCQV